MPALIERPKMTRTMYQALKRHIIKERERKKQEQEQGALLERIRKETEIRKKREEEASLTLEQTKEQVQQLEVKLAAHKQEKHELFNQLKKVLQQEEDVRRRASLREQSELMSLQQSYPNHIHQAHHPMLLQSVTGRPSLYKPLQQHVVAAPVQPPPQALKRPRSPSPTGVYPGYETKYTPQAYPAGKQATPQAQRHEYKQAAYPPSQAVHVTYANQSTQPYQQPGAYSNNQSPARKFNPTNHSAFSNYPTHFAQHQKMLPDVSPGYQLRMAQQPAYMAGSLPAQATQQPKASFSDDKYQLTQSHVRGMAPALLPRQPTPHLTQPVPQQSKSAGTAGYITPRGQAPASSTTTGGYGGQQAPSGRSHYNSGQQPGRYY